MCHDSFIVVIFSPDMDTVGLPQESAAHFPGWLGTAAQQSCICLLI